LKVIVKIVSIGIVFDVILHVNHLHIGVLLKRQSLDILGLNFLLIRRLLLISPGLPQHFAKLFDKFFPLMFNFEDKLKFTKIVVDGSLLGVADL
jgi:hypothetical protein